MGKFNKVFLVSSLTFFLGTASCYSANLAGKWRGQWVGEDGRVVNFAVTLQEAGGVVKSENYEEDDDDGGSDSGGGRQGGDDDDEIQNASLTLGRMPTVQLTGSVSPTGFVELVKTYTDINAKVEFVGQLRSDRIAGQWIIEDKATGIFWMRRR